MIEDFKEARREFFNFVLPEWLDPIYFGSICLVFIVLINWRYYKKWDKLDDSQRGVLKALLFATSIAVVGSILRLVGAI
jgi:hypothetical protein